MFSLLAALPVMHKLVMGEPYRLQRLVTFMDPWSDADGAGYQLIQSLIALGSGGLTGKGLGLGVQKLGFLPAATNDFIFSVVGEELGFVGCAVVIGAYAWLLWEGLRIALRARDTFGFALAFGITALLGLQAAVNIAVVTGSVPTKGLSLPLVSAGGSSLFMTMWAAGMLVNIARSEEEPERFELAPYYCEIPGYERAVRSVLRALLPGSARRPVEIPRR
jgi:cell division protein FtsW